MGIGRSLEVDGFPYKVGVFKYDISNNDKKLIERSINKEIIKDLEDISIDQLVKYLGI